MTQDELLTEVKGEWAGEVDWRRNVELINRWLARGDGVAVYQNEDFGHPMLGHRVFTSFGSPTAQIEVATDTDLPLRLPDGLMPDITGGINWRYSLVGAYRGDQINLGD